jgi:RNA polymerase sigma factor (sigma-70 family)
MTTGAVAPPKALAHTVEPRAEVERLLADHKEEFLRFLARRAPSGIQPEDLVQQLSVRALQRATSLREPEKGRAWLYAILRHLLAEARSTRELASAQVSEAEGAPKAEVVHDTCRCSMALLDQLKPEYREVLQRVELQGESVVAVATALGITVNNATVRLHRARQALRERLLTHCGVRSARACLDCSCWARRCCAV